MSLRQLDIHVQRIELTPTSHYKQELTQIMQKGRTKTLKRQQEYVFILGNGSLCITAET